MRLSCKPLLWIISTTPETLKNDSQEYVYQTKYSIGFVKGKWSFLEMF